MYILFHRKVQRWMERLTEYQSFLLHLNNQPHSHRNHHNHHRYSINAHAQTFSNSLIIHWYIIQSDTWANLKYRGSTGQRTWTVISHNRFIHPYTDYEYSSSLCQFTSWFWEVIQRPPELIILGFQVLGIYSNPRLRLGLERIPRTWKPGLVLTVGL